jgi:hypothetical protein
MGMNSIRAKDDVNPLVLWNRLGCISKSQSVKDTRKEMLFELNDEILWRHRVIELEAG